MKNKSVSELSYIELHDGTIICLEDITNVYIKGGFSYTDYFVNVGDTTFKISSDEYRKIRSLLLDNANNYAIL